jgi:Domain of unknown function (DUF4340)
LSRQNLIIVGVVVFGVLAFFVYKRAKTEEESYKPKAAAKELPTLAVPDDIDKISITNGDKPEIVAHKVPGQNGVPDKWEIDKPVAAAAGDASAFKSLVDNLKELKMDSQVNLVLDEGVKKDKQLDPEHAVHVVAYKGDEKKLDALFGKSGAVGQLMMLPDRPSDVFAVKGFSSYLYTKDLKNFRDRELLKFDDGAVSQVQIHDKAGDFSFTKGDKWAGTLKGQPIPKFDEEKVKELLKAYKALSAEDFADDKKPADAGLEPPEAIVTITLRDNAGKYTLKVGKVSTGVLRYAMKDGDSTMFVVGTNAGDWATAELSKFQMSSDAGAGDGGAKDASAPKPAPAHP